MKNNSLNRRAFFKTCISTASVVAANPALLAQSGLKRKAYEKVLLTEENGQPLTSRTLTQNSHFIFHYPFVSTPCFLINLDTEVVPETNIALKNGESYLWPGGVGPNRSVVAFSAICAHKLSYATRGSSFINFRSGEVAFTNKNNTQEKQSQLIYCCSERSVYDPSKGAAVLGGPAEQPLTSIIIEHAAETDHYYAVATLGGELFNAFFEKFAFRLSLDLKSENITKLSATNTTVYTAQSYTENQINC